MMRKLKIMEMSNGHFRTWDMARNTENVKNEKCTLQDREYGEKPENRFNEKCTLYDLEYGKKH